MSRRKAVRKIAVVPALPPKTRRRPTLLQRVKRTFMQAKRSVSSWLVQHRPAQSARRLRLCETVALGERRFIAVVEFEQQRFLVGGGAQSVQLLTRLDPTVANAPSPVFEVPR